MVTAAAVTRLRAANRGVTVLAGRQLAALWATLDLGRPERARDTLVEYVPTITTAYGEIAATVAADWYEDVRESTVDGRFAAEMAATVERERVAARVRFFAGHLFTDFPAGTLSSLAGAVEKYVLQPGWDTITLNTNRDPAAVGWHRETRPGACKFCRMLAGRGGVYRRSTVDFAAHDSCHCVAVPSWDANAPEVSVRQYVASKRTSAMSDEQLEAHRRRVREFLAEMPD